jgi:uncharacterized membrane protein
MTIPSRALAWVRWFNLLITGLFAGFVLLILVYEFSLRSVAAPVYAQAQQLEFIALPILAPSLLVPAVVTTAALVLLTVRRRDRSFWLTVVALILLLITLVITLAINVPLNSIEAGWDVLRPPADWASVRDRWEISHAVRTATAITAFAVLTSVAIDAPQLQQKTRP